MTAKSSWFGSEGESGGRPLLLRGRIPATIADRVSGFPYLLCIDHVYESSDETGLPTQEQYRAIENFEQACLGPLEGTASVLALVQTGAGRVRYFCYVRNADDVAATLSQSSTILIDLSTIHDPAWVEYTRTVQQIDGLRS